MRAMDDRVQQTGWRLPKDIYDEVKVYAKKTRRSMNAAAATLLEEALKTAAVRGEYTPGDSSDQQKAA